MGIHKSRNKERNMCILNNFVLYIFQSISSFNLNTQTQNISPIFLFDFLESFRFFTRTDQESSDFVKREFLKIWLNFIAQSLFDLFLVIVTKKPKTFIAMNNK